MTKHTEELIKKFTRSLDINTIPSIIVAMQEEDDLSNIISFKNCFRQLRNIAAHEPVTIVSQLCTGDNINNVRLVFTTETNATVCLDVIQLTGWLFEMSIIKQNIAYLVFWKSLMKVLYPTIPYVTGDAAGSLVFKEPERDLMKCYRIWLQFMSQNYYFVKPLNTSDPYICTLLEKNVKLFWRMAVPNMFDFLKCYINGAIDLRNMENIKTFVTLLKVRD